MTMISVDTGPQWLDAGKYKPDTPGLYWGILVVIRPTYRIFDWDGSEWKGDGGTPFYFWPERLPRPAWPLDEAIGADIDRQIKRLTR